MGRLVNDPELAQGLATALPKLNAALDDLRVVAGDARKASGSLPDLATAAREDLRQLSALTEQVRALAKRADAMMPDLQKATAPMPEVARNADATVKELPGLVLQTEETLRSIQRVVDALQRHWLLRGYVETEQVPDTRIPPENVGGGGSR